MKKNNLLIGILLFVIGLLMLIKPEGCTKAVVIILGIEAVANGIYQLLYERKLFPDTAFQYSILVRSMFSIVVGLLAVFLPLTFTEGILKLIAYLLGIYFFVVSILLFYSIGKLRGSNVERKPFVIEALVSLAGAIVMFCIQALISLENGCTIVRLCGIIVILVGVLFGFVYIKNKPLVQEPVEVMDDISGDLTNS